MAWNIVRHAFVIVFGNWKEALKASVLPFFILVTILAGMFYMTGLASIQISDASLGQGGNVGSIALFAVVALIASMFVLSWVAVTWHRFILLEEYPAYFPAVTGRPIGAYFRRTAMIILQMFGVLIPVALIVMPLMAGLLASPFVLVLLSIAVNVLISFVWLRVCISLPSVAVGEPMTSVEAWGKTRDISQTILGLGLVMILLNFAAGTIVNLALAPIPVVSSMASIAVQWVSMMVGISVLTTIYGHVVEGRPLVD